MDNYRVKITDLDHFGRGISRIDNKIIFIPFALIDEIVDVEVTLNKKKYMEGKIVNIVKKSVDRVDPICPYFTKCGGCDLLHMSYSKQLEFKTNKVKNIMNKYASISCVNDIVPSPDIYNYRNKASFKYNNKVGFNAKKSNDVVEIDECYLLHTHINRLIPTLNQMNVKDCVMVKTGDKEMIVVDDKVVNNETIMFDLGSKKYVVSKDSFFQVNLKQALNIFDKIVSYVTKEDDVLDLYCGVGTIGLYASDYCNSVLGVEIVTQAIHDANMNKELNNVTNITFKCGDVGNILAKNNFNPSLIIVDPPRNGLDKNTVEQLIKIKSKKIVYVSCDPITLARDLNILKEYYDVVEITPYDMFPNTYHVEDVAVLHRKNVEK